MTDTSPESGAAELAPAPEDTSDELATGYAVYDRTLARYVTGVTKDKPSKSAADKAVGKGHTAAIVRV